MQSRDFVGSMPGFGQHFKVMESKHGKLVMPEAMVNSEALDATQRYERKQTVPSQGTSVDAHAHEHAHAQIRDTQQVAEHREDEYLKGALKTSHFDREGQVRLLREIEKKHQEKRHSAPDSQPFIDPNKYPDHYEIIPGPADSSSQPPHQQQPSPRQSRGPNEQYTQPSTGASSARGRQHAYESPDRTRKDLLKMRDQRSIQDEHLLGHHSGRGGAGNVQLRQQRSMPAPNGSDDHHDLQQISNNVHQPQVQHGGPPGNYPLYGNLPGSGGVPPQQQFPPHHDGWHQENKPQFSEHDNRAYHQRDPQFREGGGAEIARDFQAPQQQPMMHQQQQQNIPQGIQGGAQQLQEQLLQKYGETATQLPYDGARPSNTHLPHGVGAVAPQETVLQSLSMGSTVQLRSDPPRYGVIQWIGTLPGVLEGHIAGVELVSGPFFENLLYKLLSG